ncbi:MAG TPA: NAD-dependent succinate-semialdehyde dehydrogenase [Thermoanaerobaculia bacterium]|nr:NAD-dependent succinate-semialdehyde dehydrogenase [Thermoanaerobaculia bacterium]
MTIDSVDPATGETVACYDEMRPAETAAAVDAAHRAFLDWRHTPFAERTACLRRAAELLRARRDDHAALMAREMGKPVRQGRAEADKCAWVCEHYAEHADAMLADRHVETEARRSYVTFQPLGVILAVMPWNFPFWQVFRFAAPNLVAGNGAVLKHASNVFGCALAIEEVLREAGFPGDLFRSLLIGSKQVDAVIEHPKVAAVTLTGSTAAGAAVAAKAGSVIKKTVLELGGSDPYLVLEDADLEHAAETCVDWRLINSGQSCIAAKRFLVVDTVYDDFERLFVERMAMKRMGDPSDESNDLGPQARWDLRDDLHEQVRRSVEAGARLLLGGEVPDGPGAYYPPTVLAGVEPGMAAFDEEVFGPVAALVRVAGEEEAVELANRSVYGLGAAVFTRDHARGERVARRLAAGCCFVGAGVKSDPRLPFGGIRDSGYGRELGELGIRELVNAKTVWVEEGGRRDGDRREAVE